MAVRRGLALLLLLRAAAPELRLVTAVYRHGDRSPVRTYPNDPHTESEWPQGFGQLSQVGMRQHRELGQYLRNRYNHFLNNTYKRQEVYVRSTDFDRTLMSAAANLAGLYPPSGRQVFSPDLLWQPIPVHTVPEASDQLLRFPRMDCPRYLELSRETRNCSRYLNKTQENWDFMQMIANQTGIPLKNLSLESIWSVFDTLFCERAHGLTLPVWATEDVMSRLEDLKNFSFKFLFGLYRTQEKSRLQGGLLLRHLLQNMTAATSESSAPTRRLIMYSAHDTTLVALQTALGVYSGKQPPYASCHIFELHREDNGSFTLEMFYRDEGGGPARGLRLPQCSQRCPLPDFIQITRSVVPQNWHQECQLPEASSQTGLMVGLAVCGGLMLLLIILLLSILCRPKEPRVGYQQLSSQSEEAT